MALIVLQAIFGEFWPYPYQDLGLLGLFFWISQPDGEKPEN